MNFSELMQYCEIIPLSELLDFIVDNRGKTVPTTDIGIPLIATNCIKNSELFPTYERVRYVSKDIYGSWFRAHPKPGDIIFVNKGKPGSVVMVPDPVDFCIAQDMMAFRVNKNKIYNKYLFAVLRSSVFQTQIMNYHVGTMIPHFKKGDLDKLLIPVPDMEIQEYIGNLYYTFSYKIEINNQINKKLENMAQEIFKQWFVDFDFPNEEKEPYKSSGGEMIESELGLIPKGWVVGKLDDIATIVMGQSPKGTSYNEVGEGEVFYQGRTDFSSRFPIRRLFTTEPKRMANDGDVLMSVRAPVGDLNVANERCCIGRGLSAISSSADLSSYILYVMHDLRERLNVYNGEGTVFGSINQKDLKSIKVISSCDNKTEIAFDDLIQPIDRMIRNNEDETRRLINLRDRLLPKLLSGEIRVPLDEEGDVS